MGDIIHIDLKLFAGLAEKSPSNARHFPVVHGSTVGQVLESLSIPSREAKLIFVNGVRRSFECTLNDGDRLGVFPPVGGG